MYKKNFGQNSRYNKGSFKSGGHKSGGYKPHHGGGARRSTKNYSSGGPIDPARFINKAVAAETILAVVPEHRFEDFAIAPELKASITAHGYVTPTPIQDKTIAHILEGRDVIGMANTGTGKTAAFLIPLIDKVLRNRDESVLIVVPTRELAIQINQEFRAFTKGMKLYSVCCVGGAPIGVQLRELQHKNHFIIGTPGRLKDLIDRKKIHPESCNSIVLDEADRMLDMGFVHDMRYLMQSMPKNRHTLFFSATVSPQIEGLINEFLHNPVRVTATTGTTPKSIEQDVIRVTDKAGKLDMLHSLLGQKEFSKVIIFGRTKHGVEKLSKGLVDRGVDAVSIHGNKSHSQRQRALGAFRSDQARVLVATDVAARGLDIADVTHVINYDLPSTYDDYVHRIGRTGRGTSRGKALTFIE